MLLLFFKVRHYLWSDPFYISGSFLDIFWIIDVLWIFCYCRANARIKLHEIVLSFMMVSMTDWCHKFFKFDFNWSSFTSLNVVREEGQVMVNCGKRCNIKKHAGVVKVQKKVIKSVILECTSGCHGVSRAPHHCSLITWHYKAYLSFLPFIFGEIQIMSKLGWIPVVWSWLAWWGFILC